MYGSNLYAATGNAAKEYHEKLRNGILMKVHARELLTKDEAIQLALLYIRGQLNVETFIVAAALTRARLNQKD